MEAGEDTISDPDEPRLTENAPAPSRTVELLQATIDALRAENEAMKAEIALLRPSVAAGLSWGEVLARAIRAETLPTAYGR